MLVVLALAFHKVHALACIAQHHLVEVGTSLALRQWKELHSLSNTNVI